MEGLIPFKSSTDHAIVSLYFMRISSSLCYLCSIKSADMITGFDFLASRKAYFMCLGNSFRINPLELFSTPRAFPLQHT